MTAYPFVLLEEEVQVFEDHRVFRTQCEVVAERIGDPAKLVKSDVLPAFRIGDCAPGDARTISQRLLTHAAFAPERTEFRCQTFEVADGVDMIARHDAQSYSIFIFCALLRAFFLRQA